MNSIDMLNIHRMSLFYTKLFFIGTSRPTGKSFDIKAVAVENFLDKILSVLNQNR